MGKRWNKLQSLACSLILLSGVAYADETIKISDIEWTLGGDGEYYALFKAGSAPLDPNLIMWHKMDADFDGSGIIYDATTNDFDGVQTNSNKQPVWSSSNGGKFIFDGSDDNIHLGDNTFHFMASTSFTVTAWVRGDLPESGEGVWTIFDAEGRIARLSAKNGSWAFAWYNGAVDYEVLTSAVGTYLSNKWTFVVGVWDKPAQTNLIYTWGTFRNSIATTGSPDTSQNRANYIGQSYVAGDQWGGDIGEVSIYGKALSSNEIYTIFNTSSNLYPNP